jgi:FkbM family methyltransferase
MKNEFNKELDSLLAKHGYVKGVNVRSTLKKLDKNPDYILDIGVGGGTPWLYSMYPNANFILVEPLPDGHAMLKNPPRSYIYLNVGVDREPGTRYLNNQGQKSTFFERTTLTSAETTATHEVSVLTLDQILEDHVPDGKSVAIKLDTEGAELSALEGLNTRLRDVSFLICETSVRNRFTGSYCFSELVSHLWAKGFRFCNIINNTTTTTPKFYDTVFLRYDDPEFD